MHPRNASSTLPNQSRSAKPAGIVPLSPSLAHFRTPTATRSNLHSARQPSYPTSRAFLHWRLSDDGPVRAAPPSWGRHPKPFTQKQKFATNSPYSLLRAIRRRGRSRHLAVLAQPVQGLMLTEAAQFEMADFNDRCRNFGGKSASHEQWPANILAEEFQPAEDVDVAPDGGEVEAIARANIAVCGITIVQSNIDGNMLLDLGR